MKLTNSPFLKLDSTVGKKTIQFKNMKKADAHKYESDRIKALENLNLLDTPNEKEFDEIAFLASHICQTPIALFSLVDKNRQWFKSSIGLQEKETPRDIAFCAHAILGDEIFQVEDSNKDPRFQQNPLVTGNLNVRFYAGIPISDPITKLPIGTLCVIDHTPKKLVDEQLKALQFLKNQMERLLKARISLKELEISKAQAVQASKLASLGEMSAGVAHEINNPLTIISGAVPLLKKYKGDETKFEEKIESIKKATNRITRIVSGLKKYSRSSDAVELKAISLSDIAKDAAQFTETKSHRDSTPVTLDLTSTQKILCNSIEIEQVVINLINNGIDAVRSSANPWVKVRVFDQADLVIMQVEDSGKGITKEIEKKLFQPFFTTKPIGEGTGLGLSICKGIMDNHKGKFFLNRQFPNTCFEIQFKAYVEQKSDKK